jgi:hypothetical protein
MDQTVCTAQDRYAEAAIVDHARLPQSQPTCSLVGAEERLCGAPAPQPRLAGRFHAGIPGEVVTSTGLRLSDGTRNAMSGTT